MDNCPVTDVLKVPSPSLDWVWGCCCITADFELLYSIQDNSSELRPREGLCFTRSSIRGGNLLSGVFRLATLSEEDCHLGGPVLLQRVDKLRKKGGIPDGWV